MSAYWRRIAGAALAAGAVIAVLVLVVLIPPYLIDSHGLTVEQRLAAENALRATLVTALGGIAIAFGTYFAARTLGHQRQVLDESMRQNRAMEAHTQAQIEVQLRAQLAAEKKEAASKFMEWWDEQRVAKRNAAGQIQQSAKAQQLFRQWTTQSWIVGSDEIIREFHELIRQLQNAGGSTDPDKVPFGQMGRVMVAIRKDAGNLTSVLNEADALRMILKPEDWHVAERVVRTD